MLFIKKIAFIFVSFMVLFAAGCSFGKSPAEEIYEHLEKTVSLESGFAEVQDPLVKAEKEEQKLFSEIIKLSMDQFDKIKTLTNQANKLAESRVELLKKEKDSIHKAYEEFKSIKPIVKEIDEKKLKTEAEALVKTMDDRYARYNDLHDAYSKALEMDQKLYEMLKNKELKLEDLKGYIEQVNGQYEKVFEAQKKFNDLTDQYNEDKQSFYKEAGFKIDNK